MLTAHARHARACHRNWPRRVASIGLLAAIAACSPDQVLGGKSLPPDVPDPATTKTPAGAMDAYRGALLQFRMAFGSAAGYSYVFVAGLLTDELQAGSIGLIGTADRYQMVDGRRLPEYADPSVDDNHTSSTYGELQQARGQIRQARGALAAYAPDAPAALRARLYALEGYTEVFLADLYCSGIPLSTIDFEGDYTYRAGSTTREVYEQAMAHFDSALTLASDSVGVGYLADVGKARALLALARYGEAAAAVADVPEEFRYEITYSTVNALGESNLGRDFTVQVATMTDREGMNGLPYLSGGDPRVRSSVVGQNKYGRALYRPMKYATDGGSPIVIASGVEARLIEAEAQLNDAAAGNWLTTVNALRTTGELTGVDTVVERVDTTDVGGTPQVDTTYRYDTLWVAGTGGVAHLGPLQDPGTLGARVDLLFRERAFWLFLTGHRQGDLRRLIRQYERAADAVYPTGSYPGLDGRYGGDVTAPVPAAERAYNTLYRGCFGRGA